MLCVWAWEARAWPAEPELPAALKASGEHAAPLRQLQRFPLQHAAPDHHVWGEVK